jgi:secreted trypsin-like serine protease
VHHVRGALVILAVAITVLYLGAPPDRSAAIVNGSPVETAPSWMAILVDPHGAGDICGGVLIARNLVLSAGHCPEPRSGTGVTVGRSVATAVGTGTGGPVSRRFVYPDPRVDLAIYQVDRTLSATPVTIGSFDPSRGPRNGISLTLYGYGRTSELTQAPVFDFTLRTAVGLGAACGSSTLTAPWFCMKPQGIQGPCPGDSGGPLVVSGKLIGIYFGNESSGQVRCVGDTWVAMSVTDPGVRAWINGIIISNPAP